MTRNKITAGSAAALATSTCLKPAVTPVLGGHRAGKLTGRRQAGQ
jgi:hypothetical protein